MRRDRKNALIAAVVAIASVTLPAVADDACGEVPGLGYACREGSNYRVVLPDGHDLLTHGFDAMPAELLAPSGVVRDPACVHDTDAEFHHQILYVRPADAKDRHGAMTPDIRDMVAEANGFMWASARLFDSKVELRVACDRKDRIRVEAVQLATSEKQTRVNDIVQGVRDAGHGSVLAKYWIWYDGRPQGIDPGVLGLGFVKPDDRATHANLNNLGPGYALTFDVPKLLGGASVMMHEIGHAMGVVADGSPNTSRGGHCIDGLDVMCYRDDGPRAPLYSTSRCRTVQYDCGNDDYFHPSPDASNYLSRHWNVGSNYNRFIHGCVYATGILGAGAASQAVEGVTAQTHAIPKACRGTRFGLSATVVVPPNRDTAWVTAAADDNARLQVTAGTGDPDPDVCFYKGSRLLSCANRIGAETGRVPAGARTAVVTLKAGAYGTYVLNAF